MALTGRPKTSKDVTWECAYCGTPQVSPDYEAKRRKYCSRDCFYASGGSGGPEPKPLTPNTCPTCGEVFLTGGAGRPKRVQRYCSVECRAKGSWRQAAPRQLSDIETAWLAGLFDGEGSIVFVKGKGRKSVRVSITNTHYPLLEEVFRIVQTGTIIELARYKKNPKHSDSWNWQCYGENARILLKQMLPYLIVKREKALIALS